MLFNIKEITVKKLCIISAAVLCAVGVIAGQTTKTHNDGKEVAGDNFRLITRTPLYNIGFFSGERAKAGIMLSWQDNTIEIAEPDDTTQNRLNARIYPITIKDKTLTYSSSNTEIAEIDQEGLITPKSPGSVELTVRNEATGEQAKAFLQVVQPVTGFMLKERTINMYVNGASVQLNTLIEPANASNTAVQWYSKDSNVVTVDQSGSLIPIGTGMTQIVAKTNDGGIEDKCFVTVINDYVKAETVTIQNKDNVEIQVGGTWDGIASVLPENTRNRIVEWSTSDEKLATVNKNGRVRGVGEGTVTITAKSPDGPSDSVNITIKPKSATAVASGNKTGNPSEPGVTYVSYNMTLEEFVDKQMNCEQPPKYNGSRTTRDIATKYIDPNQFCSGAYKYQFMDLSHYNGISEESLAKFLDGKGTLSGQAATFIEAAKEYNLSELYLVAHACVETGYGTSRLASGIEVNGVTVYNMYGIGAYDTDANGTGSQRAASLGWTSPAIAIKDGAKWISEHYINATEGGRQNTLYKMRWNPDNPAVHMYAGASEWSTAQAVIMQKLFAEFPEASVSYEIPVFRGSTAAVIDDARAMANITTKSN